jgi:hypothetical protein
MNGNKKTADLKARIAVFLLFFFCFFFGAKIRGLCIGHADQIGGCGFYLSADASAADGMVFLPERGFVEPGGERLFHADCEQPPRMYPVSGSSSETLIMAMIFIRRLALFEIERGAAGTRIQNSRPKRPLSPAFLDLFDRMPVFRDGEGVDRYPFMLLAGRVWGIFF